MNETIQQIPLDQLTPCPTNRRIGGFDKIKLAQLAESIKSVGVQQPAVVRKVEEKEFEIVSGERRWRASELVKMASLPCVVRELTDEQVIKIRAIENLQREDVHPLDEADSYQQLLDVCGYEVETIAGELGKSISYVYQRLKLQDLVPKAREYLVEGMITVGHAILIARLEPARQAEVLKDGLRQYGNEIVSVRALDDFIRRNILLQLSSATWKLADDQLLPEAGACSKCPKRTGVAPALFEDIGKKDNCLDRACFIKKAKASVAAKRKELEDEPHLEVRGTYRGPEVEGALDADDWRECKKSDPGAVKVLIVDGDNAGKLTYGKTMGKTAEAKAAALNPKVLAKEKAERAKEKKIKNARESLLLEIYQTIYEAAVTKLPSKKENDVVVGLRRMIAFKTWSNLTFDIQNFIAKLLDWPKPEKKENTASISWEPFAKKSIVSMGSGSLENFLIVCTFAGAARILPNDYYRIPKLFIEAAKLLGIDIELIITEKLETEGLKRKELLEPIPKYLEDGEE